MTHFTLTTDPTLGPIISAVVAVSEERALALSNAVQPVPQAKQVRALIDTGATHTCVDPTILRDFGLTPTGSTQVHTPSSGPSPVAMDQYDVGLAIFGRREDPPLIHRTIPVIGTDLSAQGIDALVGRDVLKDCVLVYNGGTGTFTLAF